MHAGALSSVRLITSPMHRKCIRYVTSLIPVPSAHPLPAADCLPPGLATAAIPKHPSLERLSTTSASPSSNITLTRHPRPTAFLPAHHRPQPRHPLADAYRDDNDLPLLPSTVPTLPHSSSLAPLAINPRLHLAMRTSAPSSHFIVPGTPREVYSPPHQVSAVTILQGIVFPPPSPRHCLCPPIHGSVQLRGFRAARGR